MELAKRAVPKSKCKGQRLFFDINFPSTVSFGGKKYWLLIVDDNTDYACSCFLKEKSNEIMSGFFNMLMQVKSNAFEKLLNKKGWI